MNQKVVSEFAFRKDNYFWLLVGAVVVIIGYMLMAGGGSADPYAFSEDIFSFRRITLAPLVVLAGYICILVGVLKKPKETQSAENQQK